MFRCYGGFETGERCDERKIRDALRHELRNRLCAVLDGPADQRVLTQQRITVQHGITEIGQGDEVTVAKADRAVGGHAVYAADLERDS